MTIKKEGNTNYNAKARLCVPQGSDIFRNRSQITIYQSFNQVRKRNTPLNFMRFWLYTITLEQKTAISIISFSTNSDDIKTIIRPASPPFNLELNDDPPDCSSWTAGTGPRSSSSCRPRRSRRRSPAGPPASRRRRISTGRRRRRPSSGPPSRPGCPTSRPCPASGSGSPPAGGSPSARAHVRYLPQEKKMVKNAVRVIDARGKRERSGGGTPRNA